MKRHGHRGGNRLREFAFRRQTISIVFAISFAFVGIYFLVTSLAYTPSMPITPVATSPKLEEAITLTFTDLNVLSEAIIEGDVSKDLTNDGLITMRDLSVLLAGFNQ